MTFNTKHRLGGLLLAASLGLATVGSAHAQQAQPTGTGLILGEVDKCVSGNETPVGGVYVGVAGGDANLARTDGSGQFVLALSPGQYTVQAAADDGTTASRPYVPVEANASLDIGVLELAGGCAGNDISAPPAPAPAQAQPTAQPTVAPTATPVPPSPTAVPTQPAPTATPAPATDQQPTDQSAPDESAPSDESPDTSSDGG